MDEIRNLILGYQTFFHVTSARNLASITLNGLELRAYDENDWCDPNDRRGQICLTTLPHLAGMQQQMKDRWEEQIITFSISAASVAQKALGLDFTFGLVCGLRGLPLLQAFRTMIEDYGTLACFDPISFHELQVSNL